MGKPKAPAGSLFPNHKPSTPSPAVAEWDVPSTHTNCSQKLWGRTAFPCLVPLLGPGHSSGTRNSCPAFPAPVLRCSRTSSSHLGRPPTPLPPGFKAFHPEAAPLSPPAESTLSAGSKMPGAHRHPGGSPRCLENSDLRPQCHLQSSRPRVKTRANQQLVKTSC